jgi:hypothetical protein
VTQATPPALHEGLKDSSDRADATGMTKTRRLTAASLLLSVVTAGSALVASPAEAHRAAGPADGHRTVRSSCVITVEQKAALTDEVAAAKATLSAGRPTAAQRQAINEAVKELVKAARNEKLTLTERRAKQAELKALVRELRYARTATERTALRAEIRALSLELRVARLTAAERAELAAKAGELRATLAPQTITRAEKLELLKKIAAATRQLHCRVVPTPAS